MKKILAAIAGLMLAIGLTACSGSDTPAPVVTVTAQPPVYDQAPQMTGTEAYLTQVRVNGAIPSYIDDETLVSIGESSCLLIEQKGAPTALVQIFNIAQSSNISGAQAGVLVGAAVKNLCPQYQQDVLNYLSTQ